jgi:uncharacterized protein (TIGR03089 family)
MSVMPTATPSSVTSLIHRRVRERGPQPFLTYYDDLSGERTELSHASFENWISKTANLLVEELDVGQGDEVAIALETHWTTAVIIFACWQVGACALLLHPQQAGRVPSGASAAFLAEAQARGDTTVSHGAPVVVVGSGPGGRLAGGALPAGAQGWLPYGEVLAFADDYSGPPAALDDAALLVSDAAGGPVRLTQRNVLAAADALGTWGLAVGARLLLTRPSWSVDGVALGLLGPYLAGGSVVLVGNPDPAAMWRKAAVERATTALVGARTLDALHAPDRSHDVAHLLCPAGVAPEVAQRAEERSRVGVHPGHGLVAATSASSLVPADAGPAIRAWAADQQAVTVGTATAHAEVVVTRPEGASARAGERGAIRVRGEVVTPDAGEWLSSGDEGFIRQGPDGRDWVFVTGRAR